MNSTSWEAATKITGKRYRILKNEREREKKEGKEKERKAGRERQRDGGKVGEGNVIRFLELYP